MSTSDFFLTPEQLAERWQGAFSIRTLANWRSSGEGPPFLKIGSKVFYSLVDVQQWESRQKRKV